VRRWDKANLDAYYHSTGSLLQNIVVPSHLLVDNCVVSKCTHWPYIDNYYESIVNALVIAMDNCIPIVKRESLKSYWSDELDVLKQASIDAHKLWILCGKPHQGIVNKMRLESKYKYKPAIKQAIQQGNMEFDDELSNLWLNKDMTKFWNKWNSRFSERSTTPDHINDCYDDKNS